MSRSSALSLAVSWTITLLVGYSRHLDQQAFLAAKPRAGVGSSIDAELCAPVCDALWPVSPRLAAVDPAPSPPPEEDPGMSGSMWLILAGFLGVFALMVWKVYRVWVLYQENRVKRPSEEEASWAGFRAFQAYQIDLWISCTPNWQQWILAIFTLMLVGIGGFLYKFVAGNAVGPSMWKSWVFVVDSGAHADEEEVSHRIAALAVTVGGMVGFALLVSIITDTLQEKMQAIRAGRTDVISNGHSLILGWTDKTMPLIEEICEANSSEGGSTIVVMAETERSEMEEAIMDRIEDMKGSVVVTRCGNPMLPKDLRMVSAATSRSIVVLSDSDVSSTRADEKTLRTVLGLRSLKGIGGGSDIKTTLQIGLESGDDNGEGPHIVAEMSDIDNAPLIEIVGGGAVETLVTHDITGRLIIQASRQPGLSSVLESLIGFEGCEFYTETWSALNGRTFGDAYFCFENAIAIGVVNAKGERCLNPANGLALEEGDRIIVIAEDNDTYEAAPEPLYAYREGDFGSRPPSEMKPSHILVCGWRRDFGDFLQQLDATCAKGSVLTLFSNVELEDRDKRLSENGRVLRLRNTTLVHEVGDQTTRRDLENLPIETYESVITVSEEDFEAEAIAADGRTIATMLLLRDIQRTRSFNRRVSPFLGGGAPGGSLSLTSEVLDPRSRELIATANISEYVMSNQLIASAIALVAEDREAAGIIGEVLGSEGNSLYLRRLERFVEPGEELSFWQVAARVRDSHEILLGFSEGGEVTINPEGKDQVVEWQEDRLLIVLAEG